MRIFALLLFCCLAVFAFRSQNSAAPPCSSMLPQCSAAVNTTINQTKNILFQTADGGESWKDISQGLPEKFMANSAFSQNGELYLADRSGVFYHKNALDGSTWVREEITGIFPSCGGLFPPEIVVNGIYAGRSQPYATVYDNGIFRRSPGTGQWESMSASLPDKRAFALVENSDGAIFVGGESGIYKSIDEGKSWKHVYFENNITGLAASNGVLLASSRKGLIRSTDGGEQWDCVLPDANSFFDFNLTTGDFVAIRAAGIVTNSAEAIPLRASTDAGKTWQPMYTGPTILKGIYGYEKAGKYIFCCHKEGVSRSKDGGNSWELVREAVVNAKEPMRYKLLVSGETVFAVLVFAGC